MDQSGPELSGSATCMETNFVKTMRIIIIVIDRCFLSQRECKEKLGECIKNANDEPCAPIEVPGGIWQVH